MKLREIIKEFETFATRTGSIDSSIGYGHGGAQARSGGSQAAAAAAAAMRDGRRQAAASPTGGIGVPGVGDLSGGTGDGTGAPAGTGDGTGATAGENPLPAPTGPGGQGKVVPNPSMNPLFTLNGQQSPSVKPNAGQIMQSQTLPRARRMAGIFGGTITINDAIAKKGTSREKNRRGSQHFRGTALDISIAGMSNQQKQQLVQAALQAGFTGFGFGPTILHVDTGGRRSWAYGNSTFGGQPISVMSSAVANFRAGRTATT